MGDYTFIFHLRKCENVMRLLIMVALYSSCSTPQTREELRPVDAIAVWQRVPERFSFLTNDGQYIPHPFFDLAPFAHMEDMSVNFVITTPARSRFSYQLDLLSGRLVRQARYCSQEDVWGKFRGNLELPPYTRGFVPRLLDQLGGPQEVIVFGRRDFYQAQELGLARSYRVRIVGAVVLQYCQRYPCSIRGAWSSKLILVAVDGGDSALNQVNNMEELRKKVDWNEATAFLQNGEGRFIGVRGDHPAYRIIGEVEAKKALVYAVKRGHLFKFEEMKSMRSSCHKLYDYLWEKSERVREGLRKRENQQQEFVTYVEKLKSTTVIKDDVEELQEKKEMELDFKTFFDEFYKTYGQRFHTCSKFVRPANINADAKRHWFFSYLTLYLKMEKLGFMYNCSKRAWLANPLRADNTRTFDPMAERGVCRDVDLDRAFDSAIQTLSGLQQINDEHFAYISYDSRNGGSHQKVHSWVNFTGKQLRCEDKRYMQVKDDVALFPENVNWEPYAPEAPSRYGIIR